MEKLTNKQHTDYCEILNDFRCKAIDIIEKLTKEYKNTLAEDIDSKLNDYHTHNEELICELWEARQENTILKKALELACVPRDDWNCKEPKRIKYTSNYDYFIEQAKESMK